MVLILYRVAIKYSYSAYASNVPTGWAVRIGTVYTVNGVPVGGVSCYAGVVLVFGGVSGGCGKD